MAWNGQKEWASKRWLPFVEIARSQGCHSLRKMLPIVQAERAKALPKAKKVSLTGLYRALQSMREIGIDPGPDDVLTARMRLTGKKTASSKGS